MESIGIALQVYLIGFVIALAMACIIKIIMAVLSRSSRRAEEKAAAAAAPTTEQTKEGTA